MIAYLGKADNQLLNDKGWEPMLEIVDDPKKVDATYARQYDILAKEFQKLLPDGRRLAEVGCGKGQLTIPLAQLRSRYKFEVVDSFKGPYAGNLRHLKQALDRAKLRRRVKVNKKDYLDWVSDEYSDKYAAVISSEFLPEIDSYELKMFLPECFRVIRRGGRTIHSYLSPRPRNFRQRLLIEADSDPAWTKTPPKEWFSPKPAIVLSKLKQAGFRDVRLERVRSNLVIRSEAAKELLKTWDVKDSFWNEHKDSLMKGGLELPDWLIISGSKPKTGPFW